MLEVQCDRIKVHIVHAHTDNKLECQYVWKTICYQVQHGSNINSVHTQAANEQAVFRTKRNMETETQEVLHVSGVMHIRHT